MDIETFVVGCIKLTLGIQDQFVFHALETPLTCERSAFSRIVARSSAEPDLQQYSLASSDEARQGHEQQRHPRSPASHPSPHVGYFSPHCIIFDTPVADPEKLGAEYSPKCPFVTVSHCHACDFPFGFKLGKRSPAPHAQTITRILTEPASIPLHSCHKRVDPFQKNASRQK